MCLPDISCWGSVCYEPSVWLVWLPALKLLLPMCFLIYPVGGLCVMNHLYDLFGSQPWSCFHQCVYLIYRVEGLCVRYHLYDLFVSQPWSCFHQCVYLIYPVEGLCVRYHLYDLFGSQPWSCFTYVLTWYILLRACVLGTICMTCLAPSLEAAYTYVLTW